ncbi:MAG TPA: VOC family protein [Caulobacteraceae bacterium]|nr:VOC family protein [Caulobacteraceae bacterium]
MEIQSLTTLLPVDDLAAAVAFFEGLFGREPTFVDGDRWAQFDLAGRRLALAGRDRPSVRAGIMVKVDDLEAARRRVGELGFEAGEIEEGPHERRFTAAGPGGWPVVCYAAKA